jgi:hypothetical protein
LLQREFYLLTAVLAEGQRISLDSNGRPRSGAVQFVLLGLAAGKLMQLQENKA